MGELGRRTLIAGAAGGVLVAAAGAGQADAAPRSDIQNIFSAAGAWRQTAAERDMLYIQGFNLARARLDAALARRPRHGRRRRLAFISDIDDTCSPPMTTGRS